MPMMFSCSALRLIFGHNFFQMRKPSPLDYSEKIVIRLYWMRRIESKRMFKTLGKTDANSYTLVTEIQMYSTMENSCKINYCEYFCQ